MPRRTNKAQRRLENRRVIVNSPIDRLDIIPNPVATQVVTRTKMGATADFSAVTQELRQSSSRGKAFAELANTFANIFLSTEAEENAEAKKSEAEAKKAQAEADKQATLSDLENSVFGNGGPGRVISSGTLDADLGVQLSMNPEGDPISSGQVSTSLGEVDITKLEQAEAEAGKLQTAAYKSLPTIEPGQSQFVDPRLETAADSLLGTGTLQELEASALIDLENQTTSDFDEKAMLAQFMGEAQSIYGRVRKDSNKKGFLSKVATAKARLAKKLIAHKKKLINTENLGVVNSTASKQLDNIFSIDPTVYASSETKVRDIQESVRSTLNDLKLLGIDKPNDYYVSEVLRPVIQGRITSDPDKAVELLRTIQGMPLNNRGATFGTSGSARTALDNLKVQALDMADRRGNETDLILKEVKTAKEVARIDIANRVHDLGDDYNEEQLRSISKEYEEKYSGSGSRGLIQDFVDKQLEGYLEKPESSQRDPIYREQIQSAIFEKDFETAFDLIDEAHESGLVAPAELRNLRKQAHNDNLYKKAKSLGLNPVIEQMNLGVADAIKQATIGIRSEAVDAGTAMSIPIIEEMNSEFQRELKILVNNKFQGVELTRKGGRVNGDVLTEVIKEAQEELLPKFNKKAEAYTAKMIKLIQDVETKLPPLVEEEDDDLDMSGIDDEEEELGFLRSTFKRITDLF